MKKKIVLGAVTLVAVAGGVAGLSAFEAHVINVTARIENALEAMPPSIEFGTVFPEEHLVRPLELWMSESFLEEPDADDIEYVIKQKPKCITPDGRHVPVETDPSGAHVCPDGSREMPLLCPYLSKHDGDPEDENDDRGIDAFHDPNDPLNWVRGRLAKSDQDEHDLWEIDLWVPCFEGQCAQDGRVPPEYQLPRELESEVFGCDIWIEVERISRFSTQTQ